MACTCMLYTTTQQSTRRGRRGLHMRARSTCMQARGRLAPAASSTRWPFPPRCHRSRRRWSIRRTTTRWWAGRRFSALIQPLAAQRAATPPSRTTAVTFTPPVAAAAPCPRASTARAMSRLSLRIHARNASIRLSIACMSCNGACNAIQQQRPSGA